MFSVSFVRKISSTLSQVPFGVSDEADRGFIEVDSLTRGKAEFVDDIIYRHGFGNPRFKKEKRIISKEEVGNNR